MRRLMVVTVVMAGLMIVAQRAPTLSEVLHSPKIFWPADFDTKTAQEVVRILSSKKLDFRGGLVSYWEPQWSSTLVYSGDTNALNGLLADLRKVPGFRIEVLFQGPCQGVRHRSAGGKLVGAIRAREAQCSQRPDQPGGQTDRPGAA